MTGLTHVEDEVRALVRRRGLDPQTQREQVRALVDEVVRDYDRPALAGPLPQLGDLEAAARAAFDAVAGLGAPGSTPRQSASCGTLFSPP